MSGYLLSTPAGTPDEVDTELTEEVAGGPERRSQSIRRTLSAARFESSRYKDGLGAGGRPGSITGEQQRRPTGITFTAGFSAEATWCCGARAGAAASGSGSVMRAEASLVSS